jgi:hypothetical protein
MGILRPQKLFQVKWAPITVFTHVFLLNRHGAMQRRHPLPPNRTAVTTGYETLSYEARVRRVAGGGGGGGGGGGLKKCTGSCLGVACAIVGAIIVALLFASFAFLQTDNGQRIAVATMFKSVSYSDTSEDAVTWGTIRGTFPFSFDIQNVHFRRRRSDGGAGAGIPMETVAFAPDMRVYMNPWHMLIGRRTHMHALNVPYLYVVLPPPPPPPPPLSVVGTDADATATVVADDEEPPAEPPPPPPPPLRDWPSLQGTVFFEHFHIPTLRFVNASTIRAATQRMLVHRNDITPAASVDEEPVESVRDTSAFTVYGSGTVREKRGDWKLVLHVERHQADVPILSATVLGTGASQRVEARLTIDARAPFHVSMPAAMVGAVRFSGSGLLRGHWQSLISGARVVPDDGSASDIELTGEFKLQRTASLTTATDVGRFNARLTAPLRLLAFDRFRLVHDDRFTLAGNGSVDLNRGLARLFQSARFAITFRDVNRNGAYLTLDCRGNGLADPVDMSLVDAITDSRIEARVSVTTAIRRLDIELVQGVRLMGRVVDAEQLGTVRLALFPSNGDVVGGVWHANLVSVQYGGTVRLTVNIQPRLTLNISGSVVGGSGVVFGHRLSWGGGAHVSGTLENATLCVDDIRGGGGGGGGDNDVLFASHLEFGFVRRAQRWRMLATDGQLGGVRAAGFVRDGGGSGGVWLGVDMFRPPGASTATAMPRWQANAWQTPPQVFYAPSTHRVLIKAVARDPADLTIHGSVSLGEPPTYSGGGTACFSVDRLWREKALRRVVVMPVETLANVGGRICVDATLSSEVGLSLGVTADNVHWQPTAPAPAPSSALLLRYAFSGLSGQITGASRDYKALRGFRFDAFPIETRLDKLHLQAPPWVGDAAGWGEFLLDGGTHLAANTSIVWHSETLDTEEHRTLRWTVPAAYSCIFEGLGDWASLIRLRDCITSL